ncbi:ML domain-containing protein [Streptomyces sp. SBC-4]|nr:ML domain-containing protein [Streptomyces sp. SBC-4]MDV5146227.1 ML domain-containing protein [Streptomyces sp. SBC-4]
MTNWSFTDAGMPTDPLQIESAILTPDTVKPGGEVKLTIKGTVQQAIEDGAYLDVSVKLGLVKLLQKRFDLLGELRNGPTGGWAATPDPAGGPIKPGKVELTYTMQLQRETPPSKFVVNVRAYTVDDDELASLDFRIDLLPRY